MNKNQLVGEWKIISGRIQRLWAESLDDQTGAIKGNLREIAGLVQREFGLAAEQTEEAMNRWQKEHQPVATLQAQGDRFNTVMADRWAAAKAQVDDARADLADRREAVEADIDLLVSRLQTRFDLTRDAAAAQVNTWLSDTRDWLDHQAKARRGD